MFQRLKDYIETEYKPKIKLFLSDTLILSKSIKDEFSRRFKTHKKLDEDYDNETIIRDVHVWFRKFLIVNQISHLLYYGTATTEEEKQFFTYCSGSSDFQTIKHPTAKKMYDVRLKDTLVSDDEGAAILNNIKNQISDTNNDSDLDLCCFAITFFTDDLHTITNVDNIYFLTSYNLPTLEIPFEKVRSL
jgi:hypothetical protein